MSYYKFFMIYTILFATYITAVFLSNSLPLIPNTHLWIAISNFSMILGLSLIVNGSITLQFAIRNK